MTYHQGCLAALTSVLLCAGCGSRAETAPTRTQFGAFSFVIPAGWSRVESDLKKTAVALLFNGTAWNNADAMLKVDVGKPALPTAKELAKSLAGDDGKIYPEPVSVDDVDGIRVETTSTDMTRPKVEIVIIRGEKLYMLMAAETKGSRTFEAVNQIVGSWKWSTKE